MQYGYYGRGNTILAWPGLAWTLDLALARPGPLSRLWGKGPLGPVSKDWGIWASRPVSKAWRPVLTIEQAMRAIWPSYAVMRAIWPSYAVMRAIARSKR